MTLEPDPDWTLVRLETLITVVEHLLPMPEAGSLKAHRATQDGPKEHSPQDRSQAAEAVARFITETLQSPRRVAQRPLILATLDELHDMASNPCSNDAMKGGRGLAEVAPDERERILRRLEADSNAYLSHALALLLQLSLEGFLGDPRHGGNPNSLGWTSLGLTRLGPRQRLGSRRLVSTGSADAAEGHDL